MNELVIKTHDFEDAKLAIKEFSEQTTTDLDLKRVNDKKGVGEWLGDAIFGGGLGTNHKVTGEELNGLTVQIQSHLRSVNSTQIKLIKQFGQVYGALEALDKDYIQAILISIKATEETSKRIEATQEQIKKIVEDQKKTLEVLKKFKQKLDSYAHLGDIDKIWNDCQKWHNEISSLSASVSETVLTGEKNAHAISEVKRSLENTDGKVVQLTESLNEQIDRIESVISFMDELETITHLKDIDEMWGSLERSRNELQTLCEELNAAKQVATKNQQDIEKILLFVEAVSKYHHLKDVDTMWDKIEGNNKKIDALTEWSQSTIETVAEHQTIIAGLTAYKQELTPLVHLKDIDNLWDTSEQHASRLEELQFQGDEAKNLIQHNKELVDQAFAAEKDRTDTALQQLNKKIQYAYWIAGGSIALALVELLVILLR